MTPAFRIEPLDRHDRSIFECGTPPLDDYFRNRVSQDVRRRVTACYVALDNETNEVAGYYTLAACSIAFSDLPAALAKKLPRYPTIPAVLIGRLAVARRFQGRKLGGVLLFDAIDRTVRMGIGAYAVIVDAKDDPAVAFYEHHGFQQFVDNPRKLFIPITDSVRKLSSQRFIRLATPSTATALCPKSSSKEPTPRAEQ